MNKPDNTLPVDAYRALLAKQENEERMARRKVGHEESALQRDCVAWFRCQYPEHAPLLFAVPNGGRRSRTEAAIMKAEGVTAGVSDLILLEARGGYGALCLEMKREAKESRQSVSQKEWQKVSERMGNRYVVCRTFEEFKREVDGYMAKPLDRGRVVINGEDIGPVLVCHGQTVAPANSRGVGGVSPFPEGRKPRK